MAAFMVRAAAEADARAMAELFAAVAAERTGIATEPPVVVEGRAAQCARPAGGSVVAVADGQVVGIIHVEVSRHGFGDLGMLVHRDWRGRGGGSALLGAAIVWAAGTRPRQACLGVLA